MLPPIPPTAAAADALTRLKDAGWREIAQGDWAWVFASPDDRLVARVVPFDPAFRLFADATLSGPPNPFLVRVDAIVPLCRKGFVTVMERLHPPSADQARRLVASIGIANQSGQSVSDDTPADWRDDPYIMALRHRVQALLDDGARRFRLWGGSDIRPANILQTLDGRHKLTDPVFMRGPEIVRAIQAGDAERLADFTRTDLQDFLSIAVFKPGPETDALRALVDRLDLRPEA